MAAAARSQSRQPPALLPHLEPVELPDDQCPALVYVASLGSAKSRATMSMIVEGLARLASGGAIDARHLPWHVLRYQDTQKLRSALIERYQPAGVNLRLAALRRVLEEAFALGLSTGDDYHRARRVRNVAGSSKPRGRALSQAELRALIQACRAKAGPGAARDAALFALAFTTGARRAELLRIQHPRDLDLEREEVSLHTKGSRHVTAVLLPAARQELQEWLALRGPEPGPLFCRVDRKGRVRTSQGLGVTALGYLCDKWGQAAGLRFFSPHDLRRTFTTELLDSGVDLHVVQELLDHQSIATTARYDPSRAKRRYDAVARLRVPF